MAKGVGFDRTLLDPIQRVSAVDSKQVTPDALVDKVGKGLHRSITTHNSVARPRTAEYIPKLAGSDEVTDGGNYRSLSCLKTDNSQALLFVTCNLLGIRQSLAQGPLDVDVFSGLQRRDDTLVVSINAGATHDQVDIGVVGNIWEKITQNLNVITQLEVGTDLRDCRKPW